MVRSENTPRNAAGNNDIGVDVAASVWDVGWGLIRAVVVLVWWAVLFPMLSVPAAAAVYAGVAYRWPAGVGVGALGVVGLVAWWIFGRRSFQRAVSGRIFRRWRRWWVYRRRWAKICALHGLTVTLDGSVLVPSLRTVRVGYVSDLVSVRMLLGQSVTAWQAQSEALTHAFGALAVQVRGVKPGEVLIEVHHGDALLDPIPVTVPQAGSKVDLLRIPIGRCESGTPWAIRLLGRHLLVAGATGAGKGSIIWSLVTGLGPAIAGGVVSVRVIDPKGGMEFGAGAALFDRFAHDTGEPMLILLREAAQVMTERAERLRGVTRLHTPTATEPLILLVIDEIASLTAYQTDRKIKAEVEQLLGLLLTQGRAVGVSVVAAVQDPSKDVLAMRQLFPTRIGMRLTEPAQVAMVLGASARDRGARCDQIPESSPGVAYVAEEETTDLLRVRAFHVTDTDISHVVAAYPPPRAQTGTSDDADGPAAA